MELFEDIELPEEAKSALEQKINAMLESKTKEWEESTAGLRAKADELLAEKKEAQRKAKEAAEKLAKEAEEKAKAENNYEQLYQSRTKEAETLKAELEKMQSSMKAEKINGEAGRIAASLTKDPAKAALLGEKLAQRLTLTDDGLKVLDDQGQLTVSSLDELKAQVSTQYAFLVDGSQAKGGGATGARGGAVADVKEMKRSDFEALDPQKRMEFAKSGGKLTDD